MHVPFGKWNQVCQNDLYQTQNDARSDTLKCPPSEHYTGCNMKLRHLQNKWEQLTLYLTLHRTWPIPQRKRGDHQGELASFQKREQGRQTFEQNIKKCRSRIDGQNLPRNKSRSRDTICITDPRELHRIESPRNGGECSTYC
jgi:hypothetical protein